ncbi:inter-alpha-trypsin inhibitor heavy chain H6 [Carcharodon carcharias]|uniref:inter-alpha-trypsin inhibitor heavy chain H6 n=1 Tax=Carcharodon carcharias TaxID=13397 RepID=UPI001B7EC8CF|nr:inter-alpha-trypsin inhibitor heavy chain H6 [Carcharodon carcharias]
MSGKPVITDFLIKSTVISRYALTTVQSAVHNPGSEAREAVFDMELPHEAFISNFTLKIDGRVYVAEVKEKEVARRVYDAARARGHTAAHLATRGREMEKFQVAVNVEAGGRADFTLSYEELLPRRLGHYELALSIRPQQVVRNLTVEVVIAERTGIEYVEVLPLRTSELLDNRLKGTQDVLKSTSVERTTTCARVCFTPSPEQQALYSSQGIQGDFVVRYAVQMADLIGDIQTFNGYFVHYFAPTTLPVVSKSVVFVIDISTSMIGTKIRQTKEAMNTILSDLRPDDDFNIITFSDIIEVWKVNQSIQATKQNVQKAKKYINMIVPSGWTDINGALLAAAKLFHGDGQAGGGEAGTKVPLIIFLTDGEPTSGVTSSSAIIGHAREALRGSLSLFCLGFGDDVDFPLLQRLALGNRGVARRIYEDADASLQLKGFYDEVASPLLVDVRLDYLDNRVEDVTRALFPAFFNGSELVVAGRLRAPPDRDRGRGLRVRLQASGSAEALELENEVRLNETGPGRRCPQAAEGAEGFVQRLWAYHTIRGLLRARLQADDGEGRRLLKEKAVALALKYNFVTPLTSLVVVRPDDRAGPTPTPTPTPTATADAGTSGTSAQSPAPSPAALGTPLPPPTPTTEPAPRDPRMLQAAKITLRSRPDTKYYDEPLPAVEASDYYDEPLPAVEASDYYDQPLPAVEASDYYDQPEPVDEAFYYSDYDLYSDTEDIEDMEYVAYGLKSGEAVVPSVSFLSSVDGDPHFMVKIPQSNESLCFTIDGHADDTLRLVEDPLSGVTVDAHLVGAPADPQHKDLPRNFIDRITVRVVRPAAAGSGVRVQEVNVSREGAALEGEGRLSIPWEPHSVTSRTGLKLEVSRKACLSVWVGEKTQFLILLHRYDHPSSLQLNHLGFYIVHGDGLSQQVRGLLGQFQRADLRLQRRTVPGNAGEPEQGELSCGGRRVSVTLTSRTLKDSPLPAHRAPCWLVHREDAARLLDAPYAGYIVPRKPGS